MRHGRSQARPHPSPLRIGAAIGSNSMTHPFTVTDQLIDDTLCTALEGGINYWATSAEPLVWPEGNSRMIPEHSLWASEVVSMGATLLVTLDPEVADDDRPVYVLTRAMMVSGIRRFCKLRKITPAYLEDDP